MANNNDVDAPKPPASNIIFTSKEEYTNEYTNRAGDSYYQAPGKGKAFLRRLLKYVAEVKAGDIEEIGADRGEIIKQTFQMHDVRDHRFEGGTLEKCGSFYEGTKVREADEFDFLYVLKSLSEKNFRLIPQTPPITKPPKNPELKPRSYYSLAFEEVPDQWKDCVDGNSETGDIVLNPLKVQKQFKTFLCQKCGQDGGHVDADLCGPAVTFYLMEDLGKKKDPIKVDITLAIAWDVSAKPLFREEPVANQQDNKIHFVAAGDFWKKSYTLLETSDMRKYRGQLGKARCIKAVKYLRDHLALGNTSELTALSTYPLKVEYLKECRKPEVAWKRTRLPDRVLDILKNVEEKGISGTLSSPHDENDVILEPSDKCYLESRRIQEFLGEAVSTYHEHGMVYTSLVAFYLALAVAIGALSWVFYVGELRHIENKELCDDKELVYLGRYLFAGFALVALQIVVPVIGLGMVCAQCRRVRSLFLYNIHKWFVVWLALGLVLSLALMGLGVGLAVLYNEIENLANCHETASRILLSLACISVVQMAFAAILFTVCLVTIIRSTLCYKYCCTYCTKPENSPTDSAVATYDAADTSGNAHDVPRDSPGVTNDAAGTSRNKDDAPWDSPFATNDVAR